MSDTLIVIIFLVVMLAICVTLLYLIARAKAKYCTQSSGSHAEDVCQEWRHELEEGYTFGEDE